MSNYMVETEFVTPKKCSNCGKEIDSGLIKISKTNEIYFCPEHGIAYITNEVSMLEHKALKLAEILEMERR